MADIGNQFEGMSGGLNASDFEKAIESVSLAMKVRGESALNDAAYNDIIKIKIKQEKDFLKQNKKRIGELTKENSKIKNLLGLKTREQKLLEATNKELGKNLKLLRNHSKAMNSYWGGLKRGASTAAVGIGKLVGKLGLLGVGITIVKKLADQFLRINNFIAQSVKQFGITKNAAKGYFNVLKEAEKSTAQFLYNLEELNEVGQELALQLGAVSRVTSGAVVVAAKLQKAFNLTGKEAADLFTTMHLGMGMTADEVERANEHMRSFAERNGGIASLVIRDLATSSALIAMSMGRSVEQLGALSLKAQRLGTTYSALEENGKRFILDFEGSADAIAEINNRLGTGLRPDIMAINAETANWLANQNMILDAVEQYQTLGYRSITTESALERLGGQRYDELVKMAKLRGKDSGYLLEQQKRAETLNKVIQDGMNIWEQIRGIIAHAIQPVLTSIGSYIDNNLTGLMDELKTYTKDMADSLGSAWKSADGIGGKIRAMFSIIKQPFADMLAYAMQYAWDNISLNPFRNKISASTTSGSPKSTDSNSPTGSLTLHKNAMGSVYNSPHLALIGEEGRSEVVIPTERVRKGLPVSKSVSNELASIGVPGYAIGRGSRRAASNTMLTDSINARTQQNAMYAAAGDPISIRRRTLDFEMAANAHREELRRMHRKEHEQQLKVLDAEEAAIDRFSVAVNGFGGAGSRYGSGRRSASSNNFVFDFFDQMFRGGLNTIKDVGRAFIGDFSTSLSEESHRVISSYRERLLNSASSFVGKFDQRLGTLMQELGFQGAIQQRGQEYRNKVGGYLDAETALQSAGLGKGPTMGGAWNAMGGLKGVGKHSLTEGVGAAISAYQQGAGIKDIAISGLGTAASAGVGMGATALLAATPLAPVAGILGPAIGSLVVGGAMKALGVGSWKKADKRKNAMKGLRKALDRGSLHSFTASNTLLKSIMNSKGKISDGSKLATLGALSQELRSKGLDLGKNEVEPLMWALIGMKNKDVANSLPMSPYDIIESYQTELMRSMEEKNASGTSSSNVIPFPRQAATANTNAGYSVSSGNSTGTDGIGSVSVNGGQAGDAMIYELRALRQELAQRNNNIRIDMDGRKVAEIVSSNQEELAQRI